MIRAARSALAALFLACFSQAQTPTPQTPAAPPADPAPTNAFIVMSDGLRWQEVFSGADERLLSKDQGVPDSEAPRLRADFWRDTPEARREALLPFFWGTLAKHGVVYGNRRRGSDARVTNPHHVSYPGYSETFCGFPNDKVDGNRKIPNPYPTVLEWLASRPGFQGRVAAFGGWDLFPFIFNTERCGFPVDGGCGKIDLPVTSERLVTLSRLREETPYRWAGAPFDSLVFLGATEYLRLAPPRAMFLGLGETDEWAHEGNYTQYLRAAHRFDAYLRELWEFLQASPQYQGRTTLIITCDHGRGGDISDAHPGAELKQWRDHGPKIVGAEETWIALIGPHVPPQGEMHNCPPVTNSQIAATLAAALGEDYPAAQPRAGAPLPALTVPTPGSR